MISLPVFFLKPTPFLIFFSFFKLLDSTTIFDDSRCILRDMWVTLGDQNGNQFEPLYTFQIMIAALLSMIARSSM